MIYPGSAINDALVTAMPTAGRAIGVAMTPSPVSSNDLFSAATQTHDFEMLLLGFSGDATGDQGPMFACASYQNGFNAMKYCNSKYDALEGQLAQELDPAKRTDLLLQQANIVWADLPVGVLQFGGDAAAASGRVHGFSPTAYSFVWSLPLSRSTRGRRRWSSKERKPLSRNGSDAHSFRSKLSCDSNERRASLVLLGRHADEDAAGGEPVGDRLPLPFAGQKRGGNEGDRSSLT